MASGMDEFTLAGPTLVGGGAGRQVPGRERGAGGVWPGYRPGWRLWPGAMRRPMRRFYGPIFAGAARGRARDVVVMNAAAVLVTAELAEDFLEGARLAEDAIDSGKVKKLVDALAG